MRTLHSAGQLPEGISSRGTASQRCEFDQHTRLGLVSEGEEVIANFDELQKQIEADELQDALENEEFMTPRDYAKARGIKHAQTVYYHISKGHLKQVKCKCGRWVIVLKEADEFFGFTKKNLTEED
jgi:hypothetical protein